MELTPELFEKIEFAERRKGYDTEQVETFLEQAGTALAQLLARVRHTEERAAHAETRLAEAEQRLTQVDDVLADADRRVQQAEERSQQAVREAQQAPPARVDEDVEVEQAAKTLLMARRTADATVNEAKGQAQSLLEDARARADRQLHEAHAEAEELVRRAGEQAEAEFADRHAAALDQVQGLESRRAQLTDVINQLESRLAGYRAELRRSAEELVALVDDPSRLGARPGMSLQADAVIAKESESLPQDGTPEDPAGSGHPGSVNSVPGDAVAGDAAGSGDAGSGDSVPGDAGSGDAAAPAESAAAAADASAHSAGGAQPGGGVAQDEVSPTAWLPEESSADAEQHLDAESPHLGEHEAADRPAGADPFASSVDVEPDGGEGIADASMQSVPQGAAAASADRAGEPAAASSAAGALPAEDHDESADDDGERTQFLDLTGGSGVVDAETGDRWGPGSWSQVEAQLDDEVDAGVAADSLGRESHRDRFMEELDSAVNEAVDLDDPAMTAFFEGAGDSKTRRFGWRR